MGRSASANELSTNVDLAQDPLIGPLAPGWQQKQPLGQAHLNLGQLVSQRLGPLLDNPQQGAVASNQLPIQPCDADGLAIGASTEAILIERGETPEPCIGSRAAVAALPPLPPLHPAVRRDREQPPALIRSANTSFRRGIQGSFTAASMDEGDGVASASGSNTGTGLDAIMAELAALRQLVLEQQQQMAVEVESQRQQINQVSSCMKQLPRPDGRDEGAFVAW